MKKLFMLLLVPSFVCANYKVESKLKVGSKTTTRVHQISESDHVVFSCQGLILDVTFRPNESKTNKKDDYIAHLKVVRTNGATIGEQDKAGVWGKDVSFTCSSEKVNADLILQVTKLEQGRASELETAA